MTSVTTQQLLFFGCADNWDQFISDHDIWGHIHM